MLQISIYICIKHNEFVVLILESTNYYLQLRCKKLYEKEHWLCFSLCGDSGWLLFPYCEPHIWRSWNG